jgi:hypothetical protein
MRSIRRDSDLTGLCHSYCVFRFIVSITAIAEASARKCSMRGYQRERDFGGMQVENTPFSTLNYLPESKRARLLEA